MYDDYTVGIQLRYNEYTVNIQHGFIFNSFAGSDLPKTSSDEPLRFLSSLDLILPRYFCSKLSF